MKSTIWLLGLLSIVLATPAAAEVLDIPAPEAAESTEVIYPDAATEDSNLPTEVVTVTLPGKGMTQDSVEERFGSPVEKYDAVGEPPITRWVYSGFTVYFEYDHVIHAVNHK